MRGGSRRTRLAVFAAAVSVLVAVTGAYCARRLTSTSPHGAGALTQRPASSPAPLPARTGSASVVPVLAPIGSGEPEPTPGALARALNPSLRDRRLGSRAAYSIVDALTGRALAGHDQNRPATPASVTKLVTAAAVLLRPGPAARITTRVLAGPATGDVVLVGGGDPTLSVAERQAYRGGARLDTLAAAVRRAVGGPVRRVLVDGSAYRGAPTAAGWDSDLVSSGNVAPITAVMVDGGRLDPSHRTRSATPDLAAGRAFARLLGVSAAAVGRGAAPAHARELARVFSAPIATLVEQALSASDNVLAEALARQVALARRGEPSFAGAAAAVRATLTEAGVSTAGLRLFDGSGLSRQDLLPAGLLTTLLSTSAGNRHPELRALLTGLPVAGFTGTLGTRFLAGSARIGAGEVRAKTGTLSGVSALAGLVRDVDGRLLVFAVLADRVAPGGTLAAEAALDAAAATLSRCGCR